MQTLKLFGKRIKELRKAKHLTQAQMAEILNINEKQMGNIETGTFFTTMPNIEKMAKLFDVEVKDLFDFSHEQDKEFLIKEITTLINNAPEEKLKETYRLIKCILS